LQLAEVIEFWLLTTAKTVTINAIFVIC
jgi:hypothetical protein